MKTADDQSFHNGSEVISGTVSESGAEKTNFYMGADNTLYYPTVEGFQLNTCRGYFKLKGISGNGNDNGNGVRSFDLNFGEGGDATRLMDNGKLIIDNEANAWYSVDGIRLNGKPTRPGVCINSGRQVVVK